MKLLVDMNLSPRWVEILTGQGIRATHWSNLGAADAPDTEIMTFARTNGYTVLTHDLDFSAILAATHGEKPSVVQIRADDVSPDAIGEALVAAVSKSAADIGKGCTVNGRAESYANENPAADFRVSPTHVA